VKDKYLFGIKNMKSRIV